MKVGIYSPYFPGHFGGGEKYILDVATILAETHDVSICIPHLQQHNLSKIREDYETFFDLSLAKLQFIDAPFLTGGVLQKLQFTRQFDVMYYLTDGSLFLSLAQKNILHIQIPFTDTKTAFDHVKLRSWHVKNTNSAFTKSVIEKHWQTGVQYVHHPLVNPPANPVPSSKKEKVILNVGRFFRQLHSKRQDVLVTAFAQLLEKHPSLSKGWKLVLIGGVEDEDYAQEVKKQAHSLPIEFYHSVSRKELLSWYAKASIYWHAAGFEVNENTNPEKVEHFGISTVEAMSYECVPIVVGKGGQVEVLGQELKQLLWQSIEECVTITADVLEHVEKRQKLAQSAKAQARIFGPEAFRSTLEKMIS